MAQEIPSTSLPGGKAVMDMFEQIKSQGFEKYFGLTQQKVEGLTDRLLILKISQ